VFERFTDRARQVLVLAQGDARALGHAHIGTEHILLGLLREKEGLAARVLGSLGIGVEEVREHVVRIVGQGDESVAGQIPFTKHAKRTLELALREAVSLGDNCIGTEHILIGLLREPLFLADSLEDLNREAGLTADENRAAEILSDLGVTVDKIRNEVIRLGGPSPHQTDEGPPRGLTS
jgi:ATP-dependent Clp protease ATP-binding subunit ClpC